MIKVILDRSNPIFGALGFMFLCFLSWRRWRNTPDTNQVVRVHNQGRSSVVIINNEVTKGYKSTKWLVFIKSIISIILLILWINKDTVE